MSWVAINKLARIFKGRLEVYPLWTPFFGKNYCLAILKKRKTAGVKR